MSVLFFLIAAVISASHGSVDWKDFRANNVKLPTTEDDAKAGNWKPVETDNNLKITWYSQPNDARFMIGFDGRQKCAGVRPVFLQSDIDSSYIGAYSKSGIFEEGTYFGQKCYYSTALFTPESVLRSGGRRMLPTDEVALGVYIKRNGKFRKLDRDGCDNSKNPFVEQGCQQGHGLAFAKFGRKSRCEILAPFYAIFDPEETGNLIGLGWLSFSKYSTGDSKTTTFYQTHPVNMMKTLFPYSPACLTSYVQKNNGMTALEVWLSYEDGQKTTCTPGDWTDNHCQSRRTTRPGLGTVNDGDPHPDSDGIDDDDD